MRKRGMLALGRRVLAAVLITPLACVPELKERCRLVTDPDPAPTLPSGFAQVDRLLLQRAICMTQSVRTLGGALARSFRISFTQESLPLLCSRLEEARRLAVEGRAQEAGRKYQALMVASQVFELAVALHAFSEYADAAGVPSGEIVAAQELFVRQIGPLLAAALSEDPAQISRALAEHGADFRAWMSSLGVWATRISNQAERVKAAMLVWDLGMLVVATYDAAGAAADIAAGRPPIPPLPALAGGGGAGAIVSEVAYLELAEAIRRLIAAGALDAAVVAGMAHLMASSQDPAAPGSRLPSGLEAVPPGAGWSSIRGRLSALRPGRSPNVYEVDTEQEMQKLFNELAEGGRPLPSSYQGRLVELPDGTRVGMRSVSRSGGPAIDIFPPEGVGPKQMKVHLP